MANVLQRSSTSRSTVIATGSTMVDDLVALSRKFADHAREALDLLVHAVEVERIKNPNSRNLIASRAGVDDPEAVTARTSSRAFIAQVEAGENADTTDYLRKRIEELRSQP